MTAEGDAGLVRLANGILWPGFLGTRAPDWLLHARDEGLAGALLFAQNVAGGVGPEGIGVAVGDDGFLVGIDEEGGQVTRVQADGGSSLPTAAQLGRVDDPGATREIGRAIGGLAASVGANLVAAPVADVNVAPDNPVIGVRAFGASAELVARHVSATTLGLADAGTLACAKHWPGHGDTVVDSHHGLAVSAASAAATDDVHVRPFAAAIAAGVPAIMTAHVVVPGWERDVPATHSTTALRRLRDLGFEGAIVTDALDMRAVWVVGIGEAAVRALAAGCDLLCVGNPANPGSEPAEDTFRLMRDALLDAVASGRIPLARLEDAHARVAGLRGRAAALADIRARAAATPLPDALAARIVRQALAADGAVAAVPGRRVVLDARPAPSWAVATAGVRIAEAVADAGRVVAAATVEDAIAALDDASHASVLVLVDRLADERQRAIAQAVASRRPDALVVDLGVAPGAEPSPRVLRALGTSRITAQVLAETLRDGLDAAPVRS